MWLKDPKTQEPSVTLTAFSIGFLVSVFKLLFSGVSIGTLTLSPFTGVDFGAAVGALGAIYWARRSKDIPETKE